MVLISKITYYYTCLLQNGVVLLLNDWSFTIWRVAFEATQLRQALFYKALV